MGVKPGTYNWTQLTDELEDGLGDRMVRVPLFGLGTDAWETLDEPDHEFSQSELVALLDESVRVDLSEIAAHTGSEPRVREAEYGRGAGVVGLALEVGEALAVAGGITTFAHHSALTARWVYRRLWKTQGTAPEVSLGAAEHLAAADLIDRVGDADFGLVGSGDLQSQSQDRSFTGGDAFYVHFKQGETLHHYQVSGFGVVTYIGSSPAPPPWHVAEPPSWPDDAPRCDSAAGPARRS